MYIVELTENFDANLEAVSVFLLEKDEPRSFAKLIDYLFEEIIPNLQRFPQMGRDFLQQPVRSTSAKAKLRKLISALGKHTEIREYIAGEYLILYAIRQHTVYLLSIKHHRQLSFDLIGHWT